MLKQTIEQGVKSHRFRFREWLEEALHRAVDSWSDGGEQSQPIGRQRKNLAPAVVRMRRPSQQLAPLEQANHQTGGGPIQAEQLGETDLIERPTIRLECGEDPVLGRCQIESAAFVCENRQGNLVGAPELESGAFVKRGNRLCIG
jgi:hypothetical protein